VPRGTGDERSDAARSKRRALGWSLAEDRRERRGGPKTASSGYGKPGCGVRADDRGSHQRKEETMKSRKRLIHDADSARIIEGISEQTLDTTEDFAVKTAGVSRRDFMRIGSQFGLTSTLGAVASMGGLFSATSLARAAEMTSAKRYAKPAKFNLKLGTIFNKTEIEIQRAGVFHFAADLEDRTDGEIRVDILGGGAVCAEPTCIQQTMQGVLDMGNASTQNASGVAPWLNALDWPYMFQSNGQIYNFFFDPRSERLFRAPYRKHHKLEFLFTLAEMRQIFMGLKWKDKAKVTSVTQLAGTKNRVTNTQLGRIAMQLMKLNPVPVAWVETLDAMRSGLIDGMETWASAATAFNMTPVISKYVGLNFVPGTEHLAMRTEVFDKLGSRLQESVLEASYMAQQCVMYNNEAGLYAISGEVPNPPPSTLLGKYHVEMDFLSKEALAEAEAMCAPTKPEYASWHKRLNDMAGFEVYESMKPVAREYPAEALAIDVAPRRWWKSA
jgi:TRAP-type C4-dicarboxylate transport system substrate-binding protein